MMSLDRAENPLMPLRVLQHQQPIAQRSRLAGTMMLIGAMAPAVALAVFRLYSANPAHAAAPHGIFLVVFSLSSFLLAIFLWKARARIQQLEIVQAQVIQAAGIDPLSKLPNRRFLEDILERVIANSTQENPVALVFLDIDRFKNVNDSFGHIAGDRLIIGIAERVRRVIREHDVFVRLGGDEFALILGDVGGGAQCAATAHRILDSMLIPFDLGPAQVMATLSLGIALCPQDGNSLASLSEKADMALYRAKQEGRNRFAFFDKSMEQQLNIGMTIADDLRDAIRDDTLSIVYQPLVARCGTRIQGVEALVRWNHPQLGIVSPEDFIPLAESRGLIVPLGEWVLRRACADARRWPDLRIAVNVSPVQFRQVNFLDMVKDVITSTGINPNRVDLELTEGVLIQDAEQAETLIVELRALGLRVGLDDFGCGYSSLIYLRRFAFDKIKIDRAFLGSLEPSGEGAIILEGIVSLGHALGLTVTAEGIEDRAQMEFLQKLGCDEMQGFFFAPPVTREEVDAMLSLERWNAAPEDIAPDRSSHDRSPHDRSAAAA